MKEGSIVEFNHNINHKYYDIHSEYLSDYRTFRINTIIKGIVCDWAFIDTGDATNKEIQVPLDILVEHKPKIHQYNDSFDDITGGKVSVSKKAFQEDIIEQKNGFNSLKLINLPPYITFYYQTRIHESFFFTINIHKLIYAL
jgi:hypothetical protein